MTIARYGPDLVLGPDGKYHAPAPGIVRIGREGTADDGSSSYKVVLDGKTVWHLGSGSSVRIEVTRGQHDLHVSESVLHRSHAQKFWIEGGEELRFACGHSDNPPRIWLEPDRALKPQRDNEAAT